MPPLSRGPVLTSNDPDTPPQAAADPTHAPTHQATGGDGAPAADAGSAEGGEHQPHRRRRRRRRGPRPAAVAATAAAGDTVAAPAEGGSEGPEVAVVERTPPGPNTLRLRSRRRRRRKPPGAVTAAPGSETAVASDAGSVAAAGETPVSRPQRLGPDGQPLPPRPPRLGPDGQPLPPRPRRRRRRRPPQLGGAGDNTAAAPEGQREVRTGGTRPPRRDRRPGPPGDRGQRPEGQGQPGPRREGQGWGDRERGPRREGQGRDGRPGRGDRRDGRGQGRGGPGRGRDDRPRREELKLYSFDSVVDRGFEDVEEEGAETRRVHWTIVKRTVANQITRKPMSQNYVLQREGADSEFPTLGAARDAVNKKIVHPEKLTLSKAEHLAAKNNSR